VLLLLLLLLLGLPEALGTGRALKEQPASGTCFRASFASMQAAGLCTPSEKLV